MDLAGLADKLRSPYESFQPTQLDDAKRAFESLSSLLQEPENRRKWVSQHRGLEIVCSPDLMMPSNTKMPGGPALTDSNGGDAQYRTLFCMWLLSYDEDHLLAMAGGGKGDVPACCINGEATKRLVQILRYNKTTRIIRVALMTLRNLIGKGFNAELIDFGVIDVLNSLCTKKFPDEDIPDDVEFSLQALVKDVKDMSSWAQYRTEVISGEVSFKNPCHKEETFWRQNIMRFEDKGFEVMKHLVVILKENMTGGHGGEESMQGREAKICVACHDLGEFARLHPRGGKLLDTTEAKLYVFQGMEHPDPEIKREALLCVQKMMVASVQ